MAEWYEPILQFGSDLQKGFNTVAPFISPLYGGIIGLAGGYGQDFGTIATNINTGKTPAQVFAKNASDAWESTLHWGYEAQKNIQWFATGASQFLDTAGGFVEALTGGKGLLGQIGAIAPIAVIGLIALIVLMRR